VHLLKDFWLTSKIVKAVRVVLLQMANQTQATSIPTAINCILVSFKSLRQQTSACLFQEIILHLRELSRGWPTEIFEAC
jgi:hypothetical protein